MVQLTIYRNRLNFYVIQNERFYKHANSDEKIINALFLTKSISV